MHISALSEFDFHPRLAASQGITLVLFSAPDCGSCRLWRRFLETFKSPLLQHCFVVDVQVATALANEYDIFHLPSLFLFIDGKFHAPVHAEASSVLLQNAIQAALNQAAHEEP